MPPAAISVDPDEYVAAGEAFFEVDGLVCDLVAAAANGAAWGAAMAGSDSSGVAWARDYDAAACAALQAGAGLADTLGHVGTLLSTSGDNHAGADASSVPGGPPSYPGSGSSGGGSGASSGSGGGTSSVIPAMPPSANGTSEDTPPGWFLVAHLLAYTWPNGHQDQLRAVGSTWATASSALSAAANQLSAPIGDISALSSQEVDAAVTTCCEVQRSMRELSNACHVLSFACADYAQHLDDAHSTVLRELAVLVAETAIIEAVGAIAAAPTAGGAEVGAQGLVAARAATTAGKVAAALARLEGLVTALAAVTREAITTIAGVAATSVAVQALGEASAVAGVAAALPAPSRRRPTCDVRKFSEYVLAPGRDRGKLAVFAAYGYSAADAQELADLYTAQAAVRFAEGDYTLGVSDQYGQRVTIDIVVPGKGSAAGTDMVVRSGWILTPDGSFKLTTPFAGWGR